MSGNSSRRLDPDDCTLVGASFETQGASLDLAMTSLTNALRISVGSF